VYHPITTGAKMQKISSLSQVFTKEGKNKERNKKSDVSNSVFQTCADKSIH